MKSFPSRSARHAAKDTEDKIKISKSDLKRMIQEEICSAMKKKEKQLDVQIQLAEQGMSDESSFKLLEARMKTMTERAEAALAHMTNPDVNKANENATKEIEQLRASNEQLRAINKQLRASNERLCASNEAFTVAVLNSRGDQANSCRSPSPIVPPPNRVIEGLAKLIKKEPGSSEISYTPTASIPMKRPEVEDPSPEEHRATKRIKAEPEELQCPLQLDLPLHNSLVLETATNNLLPRVKTEQPYPPLPELPSSSSSPEAYNYSLPPKVQLRLVLIKHPPQLMAIWQLDQEDPSPPPMESYSVFYTSEQAMGSDIFYEWQNLGEHPVAPFPMFSVIQKYSPGHKICVTVVGKDKFERYGPYSEVQCVVL